MIYNVLDICRYVINYSNEQGYGISNLKLQKILYFIQSYFMITNGNPCFDDKIEAWDFGPVIPAAYHEYKQYGYGNIPPVNSYIVYEGSGILDLKRVKFDDSIISDDDKLLINKVVDKFADYSSTALVSLTHHQSPWIDAYSPDYSNEITTASLSEYFSG